MEETLQVPNQNPITPAPPITTYSTPQPAPTNKTPWMLILIIVILLGLTSYLGYQNYQLRQQLTVRPQTTPVPTKTISETEQTPPPDLTANWKIYSDTTYTFKYPPTWMVKPGTTEAEQGYWEGKDFVEIISPSPTVTIDISPAQQTYGFGGDVERKKGEKISVTINGKSFEESEVIRVESGKTKVFVDLSTPIDGTDYHVLFGTGYPVNQDDTASYSDYLNYRDTIVQILSTLTIKN